MRIKTLLALIALIAVLVWLFFPTLKDDGSSLTIWGTRGQIRAITFAPGGKTLASSYDQPVVTVWNASSGAEQRSIAASGAASQLAYTDDGAELTAIELGSAKIVETWDAAGRLLSRTRPPVPQPSYLVFSPVSKTLVIVEEDLRHRNADVSVVDMATNSERYRFHFSGCTGPPPVMTANGRYLAIGILDLDAPLDTPSATDVRIWDLTTGAVHSSFKIPERPERFEFSPDGQCLAAWSRNEAVTVELWDLRTGQRRASLSVRVKATMSAVTFSPDGRFLAVGAGDATPTMVPGKVHHYGEVRVWDLKGNDNVLTLELDRPVTCLTFSPDGSRLAAGTADGSIRIWDRRLWLQPMQ